MSDKAAFAGTYADFKTVKTRSTFQVIVEMPIEQAERFVSVFGMPIPGKEQPVALALLHKPAEKPERPRKAFHEMPRSQQAGLLCADERFQKWLGIIPDYEGDVYAAETVRAMCGVPSRANLDVDAAAAAKWDSMVSKYRTATGQQAEMRG